MRGYFAIGKQPAGPVVFKTKYWVPDADMGRRSRRRERSAERKERQNTYAAVKAMSVLINANFLPGDLLLGLDYSEAAHRKLDDEARIPRGFDDKELAQERIARRDDIREAAEHQLELCIRRVKRLLDREGVPLLYVGVTSDMDGETGEAVRVHHHLVVNKGAEKAFVEKWEKLGYGGVSWTPLWEYDRQVDRTPIAEYLIRQVRKCRDDNRFVSSRNLDRPAAKTPRACTSDAELRVPKGCTLLFRMEYKPGQAQHIRYLLPPEEIEKADAKKRRRRKELESRIKQKGEAAA